MFESLFGAEMPLAARFFIAFLVVLALIGHTAWRCAASEQTGSEMLRAGGSLGLP